MKITTELLFWAGLISFPVIALLLAIAVDFMLFEQRSDTQKQKKSIIATGSMFLFYGVYLLMIRFDVLKIESIPIYVRYIGIFLLYVGCAINLIGRFTLQGNWANHIKIYNDHVLITYSVFGWVRHPLYVSLFIMLFGGALVYANLACFLLTAFVFIPMMYYRAKQEESLLGQAFDNYAIYKQKTGMFFPKFWR